MRTVTDLGQVFICCRPGADDVSTGFKWTSDGRLRIHCGNGHFVTLPKIDGIRPKIS